MLIEDRIDHGFNRDTLVSFKKKGPYIFPEKNPKQDQRSCSGKMKLRSQHKTGLDEVMCTPSYGPREDQQSSKLPELALYYQSYLSAFDEGKIAITPKNELQKILPAGLEPATPALEGSALAN